MSPLSIGTPLGPSGSTCGYCGPPGKRSATDSSFKKAGLIASQLSCAVRHLYTSLSLVLNGNTLGLPEDDRSWVEEIRDLLLCARLQTFLLPAVHYKVCGWKLGHWFLTTYLLDRLDALAFKPSRSQRKLINRYGSTLSDS